MMRLAEYDDFEDISKLMFRLFRNKMLTKYSEEGKESFQKQIETDTLIERFLQTSVFYIYEEKGAIEGVIELEQSCHISFLFSALEKRGIAKALCERALEDCCAQVCTVGAFDDAIGFYEKLGFVKVGDKQISNGIEFTLMGITTGRA